MSWWKHAFSVESDKTLQVNDAQAAIVDKLAQAVVRRGMTTPALMFLEMSRPLNYIGSQIIHFFSPLLSMVDTQSHRELALFLEQRGSIDYICRRIEAFEQSASKPQNSPPESSPDHTAEPDA